MGQPVFLAENLFDVTQFTGHTVTANENATDAPRVGDGRRTGLSKWTPTSLNAEAYVEVQFDRVRGFDMIGVDRGHNLGAIVIELRTSFDSFTTYRTPINITLPDGSFPGSLDNGLGVVTEDGSWLRRIPFESAKQVRFLVPAMGAGLKPEVINLYLGLSFSTSNVWRPASADGHRLAGQEVQSDRGWIGRSQLTRVRNDVMTLKLSDLYEYDQARYHLGGRFGSGNPTWILYDEDQADRAVLAVPTLEGVRFSLASDWGYEQVQLSWVEHEPKLL